MIVTSDNHLLIGGYTNLEGYNTQYNTFNDITSLFPLEEGEWFDKLATNGSFFVLTSHGRLFGWGHNSYGILGNGTNTPNLLPIEMTGFLDLVEGEVIVDIEVEQDSIFAITSEGRLFAWGYNSYYNLGDGTDVHRYSPVDITPRLNLATDEMVVEASAGIAQTMVRTSAGRVFTWGFGAQGQTGNGTAPIYQISPIDMTTHFGLGGDDMIIALESSQSGHYALSTSGRVFGWGLDAYAKFGGTSSTQYTPYDMTSLFGLEDGEMIHYMQVGWNSAIFQSTFGRVFVLGANTYNLLQTEVIETIDTVTEVNSFDPFMLVSFGHHHVIAMTLDFEVFAWGDNASGQLGQGDWNPSTVPVLIELDLGGETFLGEQTYLTDEVLDLLIPTREGFRFDGWYMDPEWTMPFELETMPPQHIELYAMWTPVSADDVTLTFEENGGTHVPKISSACRVLRSANCEPPVLEGHGFAGWFADSLSDNHCVF